MPVELQLHNKYKSLFWDEKYSRWDLLRKTSRGHKEQCLTKRCNNYAKILYKRKTKSIYIYPFCHKCYSRRFRANNPIYDLFRNLKCSAIKRNIPFEITYKDFVLFCLNTSYDDRTSGRSSSLTVDRIDSSKGYTIDNIQPMDWLENSQKSDTDIEDPF